MLQFFKSKKFNAFVAVICALLLGLVIAITTQNSVSPISSFFGSIFSPLQELSSKISEKLDWFEESFAFSGSYQQEIERLNADIAEYERQLVDYEDMLNKIESYEAMLEIKEENEDFLFERADVIGSDTTDVFNSIIINKGSNDDISVNDAVISGNYVVGVVSKVYPTYSIVSTILSESVNISAMDSSSREIAYVSTTIEFSENGYCLMQPLTSDTAISPGSLIITSGIGGIYPGGMIIGTVIQIEDSKYDLSSYAVIEPGIDVTQLEDVYVITYFDSQGVTIIDE
ncbi:MAG: rod shape-determining protein MreC [Clostridia bacterium]